ncbi:MAG: hypothetical protein GIW95_08340 [Candidatus Eremiobacteraeota bacterium]|nr:hypothetical protein [Candidatus Eremiobacteraeota bacterium]
MIQHFLRGAPFLKRCSLAAAVIVALLAPQTARSGALPALERFDVWWSRVHDFSVTIDAYEALGSRSETSTIRYTFREPDRAKLEITAGAGRGGVVVWRGGNGVVAYKRGFSLIKWHLDAHDARVVSLRGNSIFTPNIGRTLACFDAHRVRVAEVPGLHFDGQPTEVATLDRGVSCADDPPEDKTITRDVVLVSPNGLPLLRERFEGDLLIERWRLRDLKINVGLKDSDFR